MEVSYIFKQANKFLNSLNDETKRIKKLEETVH